MGIQYESPKGEILMSNKQHIVVVGGGFAGLSLIRSLRHEKNIRITLVTDEHSFRYCPALYRTATGHRQCESFIPIHDIVKNQPNVQVVYERATHIGHKEKTLHTTHGTYHYDFAIIALGVVTSYFGIKGLEQFSYSIKTAKGLRALQRHLHKELLDDNRMDKNYVVVGAGPTGVELAASLASYLRTIARKHGVWRDKISIELVEAAPRILPNSHEHVSREVHKRLRKLGVKILTNTTVRSQNHDTITINSRTIPSRTVIWTAGVINNPFFKVNEHEFTLNERGRVLVDDRLRTDSSVYVIGDNAATHYSGMALTAVHNGRFVAKDIQRVLHGKQIHDYKPFKPISVIPVGSRWAVVEWGRIMLSGWPASLLRMFADLIGYSDVMGWNKAIKIWIKRNQQEEQCPRCKHAL